MDLQWNDVPRAESYEVQFINIDQQQWWWTHLPAYGIEIATYGTGAIIRGLSHNGPYYLRVRAVNSLGASEWSDYVVLPKTDGPGAWAGVSEPSNYAATGTPTINGTPITPGKLTADVSGIGDENGLDRVKFNYQWTRSDGTDTPEIDGATNISYRVTAEDIGSTVRVRVSFVDRHGFEESLTSAATAAVTPDTRPPLTAEFLNTPSSHDGQNTIIFELRFSEAPALGFSYRTLQDHAFTVTEGEVTKVRRLGETGNMRWEVSVRPEGDGGVNIVLPATEDCDVEGAICTGDARTLSSTLEVTIRGPHEPNSPATGAPTITGTARVGETLTADSSGIADSDGLDNATHTYQWTANDGTSDTDIQDATGATYTLVSDDAGKAVKVKVNFTDDAGNDETLTSAPTATVAATPNSPATGAPTITGTAQVGETLTVDTLGVTDEDGLGTASFTYQWLADDTDIQDATGATYTLVSDEEGKAVKVRVSFTDAAGNAESLTSAATSAVAAASTPLTAQFLDTPSSHDGQTAFTFELRFSEDFSLSYVTLRDHAFTVTGGEVTGMRRLDSTGNIRWEITVRPDGDGQVTVALPVTGDCEDQGAICTEDGRTLSNRTELTVQVPAPANSAATGTPTITGTAQVGETLTADTSGIADSDGLDNVSFTYQWLAHDTDIAGATDSSYTLTASDAGKAIKVRVSFTDDAGNVESLTSAPLVPDRPYGLTAGLSGNAVVLTWKPPVGQSYMFDYQILRNRPELGEAEPLVYVTYTETEETAYTDTDVEPGVLYVYRVKAVVDVFGRLGEASEPVEIRTAESTPGENSPAAGAPTISGTVQVGETLTADTSGIADGDGLDNVSFTYQWVADAADIAGATDSSYTLTASDAGKAIKVRVSFTDDEGNVETLTSAPTEPVTDLVWSATLTAGSSGTYSGYSLSDSTGALSTDAFSLGAIDYSVNLVAEDDEGMLSFVLDHALLTTFTLHVGALRFSSEDATSAEADHGYIYRWDKGTLDWSAGDEAELGLILSNRPLMAAFADTPPSHDGQTAFTFELRFSEEFDLSYVTLRDHAFTVTGGEVTEARRLDKPGNIRWEITVRPDVNGEVFVALPATEDCGDQGAICTEDGRMLSNRTELTVLGPGD